jgi:hypothetical protein
VSSAVAHDPIEVIFRPCHRDVDQPSATRT